MNRIHLLLAIMMSLSISSGRALAFSSPTMDNTSFTPGEIWNDTDGHPINAHGAGFLYVRGTYYWYGEFKTAGSAGNKAHVGISCYSSKNLHEWKNQGIVLKVSEDPASDIQDGSIMERPKALYNETTHKYVMWFHLELKDQGYKAARVGVAVSDSATGPFTYLRSFRPDEQMSRDMTLFQDDDGLAYLVTSSEDNKTMHVSRLTADFLATAGTYQRIFVDKVLEAPAIFKRDGKYYFVGSHCTGWLPNPAVAGVADSPLGPWTMLGNPARGPGAYLTFGSQSAYVLPVAGLRDAFIFISDRWNPQNAIDGRYVWLPVRFSGDTFTISWYATWNLDVFAPTK